ncbi:hypothetical protein TSAR_007707 [Trichomalopsis sarcophagae]|uniref:Uncharacterized protein n=1 Tax=Trichomalopsis sarcophagae TaxID=543379 RepID=A0A232ED20_9HYME|nr:hypothetical protein TSAR_007707 [Trichomalopsis sarcophagae]
MRDFEEGMRKSAHKAFPDAQIIGIELEKAWDQLESIKTIDKNYVAQFLNDVSTSLRSIHSIALQMIRMPKKKNQKKNHPLKHRLVKKLIGLALLPENKIIEGFNVIEEECKETFPNDKRVHAFLDYYRKQWLKNPSNFCAINKNARKKKLFKKKNQKKNHPLKHRLVKKLIGLALLPENKIIEGFNGIEEECKETFPNDKRVHAFLDYYRKQWLKNPSNFCTINKNARKKKLFKKKNQKKNHPLKHRLVKKLIGLALLPENKIIEGFNVIEEECKETFPNDKRVHAFLDYYRKQWLKNPSNFCVYRLKDRTNNSLESYHRTLNSLLRKTPGLH